jgi:hypothetical protein
MYGIFLTNCLGQGEKTRLGAFYLPASLSASDFKELAGRTQGSHNHVRDPSVSPS